MDPKDKDHIRRNYLGLTDSIKDEIDKVCDFLYTKKIITDDTKEEILEGNRIKREMTRALLDLIVRRGPYAYEALYKAVLYAELFVAADILRPGSAPHQSPPDFSACDEDESQQMAAKTTMGPATCYDSPDEPLPDTWPNAEVIRCLGKVRNVESNNRRMNKLYNESFTVGGKNVPYQMKHQKRGVCLVFNNEKFSVLDDREGSNKDRKSIEQLFRALGFDVTVYNNRTCEEMWQFMEEVADSDHSEADCFVMFIFSHGHAGVVFGTDGEIEQKSPKNAIKIRKIRDKFSQVPSLVGKPKLFFIQACQGEKRDKGMDVGNGGTQSSGATSTSAAPSEAHSEQLGDYQSDSAVQDVKATLNSLSLDQTDSGEGTQPTHADVFIAMATTEDYVSWRHSIHGSWFIQAVAYILGRYAYKYNLNDLMDKVKGLVSKAETSPKGMKQIGESISTLKKTFYFFPGLFKE